MLGSKVRGLPRITQCGKGSRKRPLAVSFDQYGENWDNTFSPPFTEKASNVIFWAFLVLVLCAMFILSAYMLYDCVVGKERSTGICAPMHKSNLMKAKESNQKQALAIAKQWGFSTTKQLHDHIQGIRIKSHE